MTKLYRAVWKNPTDNRMCASWWELSNDSVLKLKEHIEKEYNVECSIETKEA